MTDIVDDYCAIATAGAAFADPRLAALRQQMTGPDLDRLMARLTAEAEAAAKEAEELEAFGRRKFGPAS